MLMDNTGTSWRERSLIICSVAFLCVGNTWGFCQQVAIPFQTKEPSTSLWDVDSVLYGRGLWGQHQPRKVICARLAHHQLCCEFQVRMDMHFVHLLYIIELPHVTKTAGVSEPGTLDIPIFSELQICRMKCPQHASPPHSRSGICRMGADGQGVLFSFKYQETLS